MVGILHAEHADSPIRFFNLDPGPTWTEASVFHDATGQLRDNPGMAPPSVAAAAIAWLATAAEARELSGQTIHAQELCLERNLHASWR